MQVYVHRHTTNAIAVTSEPGDSDKKFLPLSQIDYDKSIKKGWATVTLPLWLAEREGLA